MRLKDIVSITGKSGLYKILSNTHKGIVVESMDEKKSKFMVDANFQVAVLGEITIYTNDGTDLYIKDIFKKIREKDGDKTSLSHKSKPAELRSYFQEVAPNHDEDRVYPSDIKKIVQWYNILSDNDMLYLIDQQDEEEEEGSGTSEVSEEEKEKGEESSDEDPSKQ